MKKEKLEKLEKLQKESKILQETLDNLCNEYEVECWTELPDITEYNNLIENYYNIQNKINEIFS